MQRPREEPVPVGAPHLNGLQDLAVERLHVLVGGDEDADVLLVVALDALLGRDVLNVACSGPLVGGIAQGEGAFPAGCQALRTVEKLLIAERGRVGAFIGKGGVGRIARKAHEFRGCKSVTGGIGQHRYACLAVFRGQAPKALVGGGEGQALAEHACGLLRSVVIQLVCERRSRICALHELGGLRGKLLQPKRAVVCDAAPDVVEIALDFVVRDLARRKAGETEELVGIFGARKARIRHLGKGSFCEVCAKDPVADIPVFTILRARGERLVEQLRIRQFRSVCVGPALKRIGAGAVKLTAHALEAKVQNLVLVCREHPGKRLERVGCQLIVGVKEGDVGATGRRNAISACEVRTSVYLFVDYGKTRILCSVAAGNVRGVIGACVDNNDRFPVCERLCLKAVEACRQVFGIAVRGDNNRKEGHRALQSRVMNFFKVSLLLSLQLNFSVFAYSV